MRLTPATALRFGVFAVALVVGSALGYGLKLHREQLSLLWPPVGLLAGALVTATGPRAGVYVALFCAVEILFPLALGVRVALGPNGSMLVLNVAAAAGSAWCARRAAGRRTDLGALRVMAAFLGGALAMGAITGVAAAFALSEGRASAGVGGKWCLDIFLSILTLGPLTASLAGESSTRRGDGWRGDLAAVAGLTLLGGLAIGRPATPVDGVVDSGHVVLPFFLWAIAYGGAFTVRAGVLATTVLLTVELDGGAGPFAHRITERERLATLQAFVAMAGAAVLLLDAASIDLRRASRKLLREAEARRLTLDALLEERTRVEQVTSCPGLALFLYDLSAGGFLFVSEGYEALFGRPRAGLLRDPRDWLAAVHPLDRAVLEAWVGGDVEDTAARLRVGTEASHRTLLARIEVIRGAAGRPARVAGVVSDITRTLSLEEEGRVLRDALAQAQRLEVVGKIAAGVAHDLNNLYTVMLASVSGRGGTPPEFREALGAAVGLTRGLLSLGRPSSDAPRAVHLRRVVELTAAMVRPTLAESELTVEATLDPAVTVRGHDTELQQVVLNLVLNARDAGAKAIRVTLGREGDAAVMAVIDDGPGVAAEHLPHLFEAFFTTKGARGTGLGLAISKRLVEGMRGTLGVSTSPAGTTFTVRVPVG
jgi:signal transduction histidine kinase